MLIIRRSAQRNPELVQQEMEQLFRQMMPARPHVSARCGGMWRPPIEVYETHDALVISAEIAGIDESLLNVVIEHDLLSIRGDRPDPRDRERRSYREAGIPYGPFGADIYIPFPVDADRIEADYQNGFLHISLPKTAARTIVPRRIEEINGHR